MINLKKNTPAVKVLSTALCLTMGLSLAACSKDSKGDRDDDEEETEQVEETIIETTETEMEFTIETIVEETAETEAPVSDSQALYQDFLDDFTAAVNSNEMWYSGPEGRTSSLSVEMPLDEFYGGCSYTFLDIDNDGTDELFIAEIYTNSEGVTEYNLKGAIDIDADGNYVIFRAGWSRSRFDYLGNGYFHTGGSGGASLAFASIEQYDPSTYSLSTVAEYVIESIEPDPSELPIMFYSLFEGDAAANFEYDGDSYGNPNALHDEAATERWEQLQAEYSAGGTGLENAVWTEILFG